jgi:site-specific DNA-methyltransferase (adenine-specific)
MSGKNYARTTLGRKTEPGSAARFFYTAKASKSDRNDGYGVNNDHPTVKPTDLMRWLVRLVTPPGGTVCDPFLGSGSTLKAARDLGCKAIGIELSESYCEIAAKRLAQQVLDFA